MDAAEYVAGPQGRGATGATAAVLPG